MRCANCGKGVFSAVSACPFCRTPFSANAINGSKQAPTSPTTSQPRMRIKVARWQIMVASAVIVAGITPFVVLWATSGLVEPIVRQLDDFKRGDLQAAYGEMSTGFHQEISFEKFSEFVNDHPALSHNVSHSFTSRSSSSSMDGAAVGDVKGSVTDDRGAVVPVDYRLVKEDGTWKIKGIHLGQKVAAH